jgi:hypothetical protein
MIYRYLSENERYQICVLKEAGHSQKDITSSLEGKTGIKGNKGHKGDGGIKF